MPASPCAASARDLDAAARRCSPGPTLARRRQVRAARPGRSGRRACWSTCRPACNSTQPIVVRWALGERVARLVTRTLVRRSARTPTRRSSRSSCRRDPDGRRDAPVVLRRARSRSCSADGAASRVVEPPGAAGRTLVAFQHRTASIGEGATLRWALAQLGGRLVRSRVDNRLEGDRSSVEQVEIVFGGGDQLFDLTSYTRHIGRDTTGNLLSRARSWTRRASYMKGLIMIEQERGRHRQLPRRVRDEPLEEGPRGGHPEPRDRPAGLPPGRPLELGRADRRDAAVLPREPRHPAATRRASSSSSASSSRSSPASRWPRPRTACASCSRRSGRPAAVPARPTAACRRRAAGGRDPADRPAGVDEVPPRHDADGLGRRHRPVARRQRGRRRSAPSRASAATSTSSSTRAS